VTLHCAAAQSGDNLNQPSDSHLINTDTRTMAATSRDYDSKEMIIVKRTQKDSGRWMDDHRRIFIPNIDLT
jgi:hypothetical protein